MVARKNAQGRSTSGVEGSRIEYASVRFPHTDWDKPVYTIGVAAELAGVHPQTLRTYEQKGLVTPKRTSGGTRMYSLADLDRLALINELTEDGINLAGVMRILDLESNLSEAHEQINGLHERIRRLAKRVEDLQAGNPSSIIRATSQEHSIVVRKIQH